MTVTFAGEQAGSRKGTVNMKSRKYSRSFLFKTSTKSENATDVLGDVNIPGLGQAFPSDPSAFVTSISCTNSHPYSGWVVSCEYSTIGEISEQDPTSDEPQIIFSTVSSDVAIWKDIHGNFLANTVGDPFSEPPLSRAEAMLQANISFRRTAVPTWLLAYVNSTNDSAINISGVPVEEGQAKIDSISVGAKETRDDLDVYPVTISVSMRPDGWEREVLNCGYNGLRHNSDGELEKYRLLNDDKTELTSPLPLSEEGHPLYGADASDSTKVHFIKFEVYPRQPFQFLPGVN